MLEDKRNVRFEEATALMNCRRLPGRLNRSETAVVLGFQGHDIAALVSAKLLKPLGKPAANAPKYFAAVEMLALAQDREWLSSATRALSRYWSGKNNRKKTSVAED